MADDLLTVQQSLLDCVCDVLADAGRPVCSCFPVIGQPISGLCCECEGPDGGEGKARISLQRIFDADATTLEQVTRIRPCRGGTLAADFTLVIFRCYPTIDEYGQIDDAAVAAAADNLALDAQLVHAALSCCPDQRLIVQEVRLDSDPDGGCSALGVLITAEIEQPNLPTLLAQVTS